MNSRRSRRCAHASAVPAPPEAPASETDAAVVSSDASGGSDPIAQMQALLHEEIAAGRVRADRKVPYEQMLDKLRDLGQSQADSGYLADSGSNWRIG